MREKNKALLKKLQHPQSASNWLLTIFLISALDRTMPEKYWPTDLLSFVRAVIFLTSHSIKINRGKIGGTLTKT